MSERAVGAAEIAMSFAKPEGEPTVEELDNWATNLMGDVKYLPSVQTTASAAVSWRLLSALLIFAALCLLSAETGICSFGAGICSAPMWSG